MYETSRPAAQMHHLKRIKRDTQPDGTTTLQVLLCSAEQEADVLGRAEVRDLLERHALEPFVVQVCAITVTQRSAPVSLMGATGTASCTPNV